MSAMEKMLMSMLGVDANELSTLAKNLGDNVAAIAERLKTIEEKQLLILERLEHDKYNDITEFNGTKSIAK